METELQLLDDIKGGKRGATRSLYDRFAAMAMATALRIVSDQDQACDVVQDSFVKILTSVDRFDYRGEGSLKAWVMTIVTHQAIDYVRKHERILLKEMLTEEIADEPRQTPADYQAEEPDVGRVPPDVLNRLIGLLPTGYRIVLNLYVFEQLTHKEIAHLLGIRPESSASQYSRAKQLLAKHINNYLKNRKQ